MSSFGCCFWWFLLGALLGWLLNYWLSKRCCNKTKGTINQHGSAPAPETKAADTLAATAPKATVKAPTPAKPKAAPTTKTAPAKPKVTPVKAKAAPVKDVTINLAAAKAAGIAIKNANDLTVIEGIGPKINELFKDNGLKTFAQVATATVPQMRTILDKGGARFRIANPETWAKQAKLATNNQWKELKKLQDELSGGLKK